MIEVNGPALKFDAIESCFAQRRSERRFVVEPQVGWIGDHVPAVPNDPRLEPVHVHGDDEKRSAALDASPDLSEVLNWLTQVLDHIVHVHDVKGVIAVGIDRLLHPESFADCGSATGVIELDARRRTTVNPHYVKKIAEATAVIKELTFPQSDSSVKRLEVLLRLRDRRVREHGVNSMLWVVILVVKPLKLVIGWLRINEPKTAHVDLASINNAAFELEPSRW